MQVVGRKTRILWCSADEHHEYLVLVAKEHCAADAGRRHGADFNLDNGLTRTASLVLALPPRSELSLNG
jgi:hypothetical protein